MRIIKYLYWSIVQRCLAGFGVVTARGRATICRLQTENRSFHLQFCLLASPTLGKPNRLEMLATCSEITCLYEIPKSSINSLLRATPKLFLLSIDASCSCGETYEEGEYWVANFGYEVRWGRHVGNLICGRFAEDSNQLE